MNYRGAEGGVGTAAPGDTCAGSDHGMLALLGAARRLHDRLEAALGAAGLSVAKYHALDQLARSGGALALGELAACLQCVRSNVTQLVDRLETEGYVRRVADPADRRTTRAELTPLGMERHGSGAAALHAVHEELARRLTDEERTTLLRALAALA